MSGHSDSSRKVSNNDPSADKESQPSDDGNNNGKKEKEGDEVVSCKSREEYICLLNNWLLACNYWYMCSHVVGPSLLASSLPSVNQERVSTHGPPVPPSVLTTTQTSGQTFILPKIWRRAAAEVIDFFILLVMKIAVTYIAIDSFDLIDLNKYDLSLMEEEFDAYELAYELTSEILVIESVHRIIVIFYETIFLTQSLTGRIGVQSSGGSTPGKKIMGLRVVSCSSIQDLPDNRILVTPAQDIGFWCSLFRAVIKNFSSILFLPASLTIFVSSQNRAAYDIACRCLVVQELPHHNPVLNRNN